MTTSNDNSNNNINDNSNGSGGKDVVEKLTEEIKNIEIKQDDSNGASSSNNDSGSNNNNNNNDSNNLTATSNTTTATPVFNTSNINKKETNSIVIDEKLAERLNNIVNEDGKPRIIAHTTTSDTTSFYDEVDIEDMDFDEDERVFFYPCPCGDRFRITEEEILQGEEIAICPSCSLLLKVIYSPDDFIVEE